jgi:hypothetical protein
MSKSIEQWKAVLAQCPSQGIIADTILNNLRGYSTVQQQIRDLDVAELKIALEAFVQLVRNTQTEKR